jgi:DNA-binding CsgD family transcriptional regulator/tetratricopeptide (TPR) repeat protein
VRPRIGTGELVGRADELGMLTELLSHIGDPRSPGCVLVTGDAGVGKTRLLAELADVAAAGGIRLLRGGCLELSEALPYGPFVDVLEQIGTEDGIDEVRELAGGWADGLHALMPAVGSATAGQPDGQQGQQALFQAVATVLMGVAAQGPTLLLVEDLHWASQATVDLLTFVVYRVAGSFLLIVGSVRDEGVSDSDPVTSLIASLHRSRRSVTVELSGLGREDVGELISRIRGVAPEARHVARVHELTGGNPLLVEELLAAGFVDDDGVVSTVASWVLGHRLRQLDEDARRVVAAAAVGGARCEQDLVVRVVERAGRDSDRAVVALRRAVDIGILVSAGSDVEFRHALLREAALGSLLFPELSRLHAHWAATLADVSEATPNISARLAHHWLAAGELDEALPALIDAAAEAQRLLAYADASRHLQQALEIWDRCADTVQGMGLDRRTVLDRAVTVAQRGGRTTIAARWLRELIGMVEPTADAVTLGAMYARLALMLVDTPDEALAACERARQLVPAEPPSAARVYVLTQERLVRDLVRVEDSDVGQEALDAARELGDLQLEATALVVMGTVPVELGELSVDDGVRRLERARTLATRFDDHETIGRAHIQLSWLLMLVGRLTDAYDVAKDGMRWAERVGRQHNGAFLRNNAAWAALLLGRWEDGAALLDLPGWDADPVVEERAVLEGEFAVARGDLAGVDGLLRPIFEAAVGRGDAELAIFLGRPRALALLWQRHPAEAIDAVERAFGAGDAVDGFHPEMTLVSVGLRACADLHVVASAHRDRDGVAAAQRGATHLAERMTRRDGTTMLALEQAHRETARAELARAEGHAAAAAWSAAADGWDDIAVPHEAAYARWRWAEALLAEGGTRTEAASGLRPAVATARGLGAQPLLTAMQALVTRARLPIEDNETDDEARVEPSPLASLGLTVREQEVLRRVAAGATNRQIAEELFISESTAGVHVSNILRKLGVSNRVQAAAVAHELLSESDSR